jgi:hypothetical protein
VKLVFLEVHGVLMMPICENVARLLQEPVKAFKPAVDALNFITRTTGAKIVITSAWRNAGIWVLEEKFKEWGVEGKIIDGTPIGLGKSDEINKYLVWSTIPESYVVIDCEHIEDTNYAELSKHIVITDPKEGGLTDALAKRAVEILNKMRGEK